jgi:4-hydroxyphenylpyruvate dioxygenase-like putative hemolysin
LDLPADSLLGGTNQQKKKPRKQGFFFMSLAESVIGRRLAPYAADAAGAYHVDHVADVLNARHMPNRFLHELLQVKRRQLARQHERAAAVLDEDIANPTAKVRVVLQVLSSQRA